MQNKLVSILIPAYNSERWIAETLESALSQTWQNMEIIVVDDGSKDNTLAIAKQYESSKLKVISQDNQGQSAAENRALGEAQGDFIQYLDADDLLAPDKIERQIKLLKDADSDFVASGEWARFFDSPEEAVFIPQVLWADFPPVDWLVRAWERGHMMHGAAWLIPHTVIEKAGPWNSELSLINDFDYFSRVLLASQGVTFCWRARSYYRSGNSTSLSGARSYAAWQSAVSSMQLGTQHLLSTEDSLRTRRACANALQSLIYTIYPDAPELIQQLELRVSELGGADFPFPGGTATQLVSRVIGWRCAKSLQQWSYRRGYQKIALGWHLARLYQRLTYQFRSHPSEESKAIR